MGLDVRSQNKQAAILAVGLRISVKKKGSRRPWGHSLSSG
jgi:hypothetical protein